MTHQDLFTALGRHEGTIGALESLVDMWSRVFDAIDDSEFTALRTQQGYMLLLLQDQLHVASREVETLYRLALKQRRPAQ